MLIKCIEFRWASCNVHRRKTPISRFAGIKHTNIQKEKYKRIVTDYQLLLLLIRAGLYRLYRVSGASW